MTWVQIDDAMPEHPKIMQLSDRAFRSHIDALCYSNRNLTDGFIPKPLGERRGKRYAAELVTTGVWDEAEGGYQIHDFHDYQPTKAEVLELREKRAQAGRLGARRRWGMAKPMASAIAPVMANGWQNDAPNPQSQSKQPFLGQSSSTTSGIDLEIKNGKTLKPGIEDAILSLLRELPDATDGTIGRLVKLAEAGAQQSDFHDARQGIAATSARSPSRVACTIIANRIKARA